MSKLKLLDLFSGIGGFSLGLESTGYFETIGFVEKDQFCQKVLRKNFKNKSIEGDIRNVKGEKYKADIITAGFPCQPFSVAGKRRGQDDDRYLWDETIRVIRECKPRWVIGENVEGIINIANGTILQQIQKDLEEEGFKVQCLVIPASGIGAWHQRKRVWIIGHNLSNSNNSGCENRTQQHRGKQAQSEEGFDSSSRSNIISNSDSIRHRGWSSKGCANEGWSFLPKEQEGREMGSETSRRNIHTSNSNSKGLQGCSIPTNLEGEQRQVATESSIKKQCSWWEAQSDICRNVNGISYELDKDRSNRIKSLGNSIVPLIARELGLAIMKAELDEVC